MATVTNGVAYETMAIVIVTLTWLGFALTACVAATVGIKADDYLLARDDRLDHRPGFGQVFLPMFGMCTLAFTVALLADVGISQFCFPRPIPMLSGVIALAQGVSVVIVICAHASHTNFHVIIIAADFNNLRDLRRRAVQGTLEPLVHNRKEEQAELRKSQKIKLAEGPRNIIR
jgi:hypothetical protein